MPDGTEHHGAPAPLTVQEDDMPESYAWPPKTPTSPTPLLGRLEHTTPGAEPIRVRRIRYPEPNTLGLTNPTQN